VLNPAVATDSQQFPARHLQRTHPAARLWIHNCGRAAGSEFYSQLGPLSDADVRITADDASVPQPRRLGTVDVMQNLNRP
jgi:hypothetical protein